MGASRENIFEKDPADWILRDQSSGWKVAQNICESRWGEQAGVFDQRSGTYGGVTFIG